MFGKLKNFVSELDKFLEIFDRRHGRASPAQQAEMRKHQQIFEQRDHAQTQREDPPS